MNNKAIAYSIMIFMVLALAVSNVCAAFVASDMTFSPTDGKRGQSVTQNLHILNNGTDPVTLTITSNLPAAYQAVISQTSVAIAAGASMDIPVTIFVPLNQDSGTTKLSGGILVSGSGQSDVVDVSVTAANHLEISKVQIDVDGQTSTLRDGEDFDEDLKPGSSLKFIIKVKNTFPSTEDYEIQDIEVEIEGDGDLDLDDSDEMSDLDQGDYDTVTFTAQIPSDAEDGDDYDIDIRVKGEDENGAQHEDKFSATLEISRGAHEITVKNARFSPSSTVECSGKVTMNIDVENTGKNDEDNVQLEVTSENLDIEQGFYLGDLESDDTVRKSFSFDIGKDVKPGQYDFIITTYYDVDEQSDVEVATLNVASCTADGNNNQGTNEPNTSTPNVPVVIPTNGATPVYGTASFTDSPTYIIVLAVAVILLLLILVMVLVKFIF